MTLELRGRVLLRDFRPSDRDAFVGYGDEAMFEYMKFRLDESWAARSFEHLLHQVDGGSRRVWNLVVESLDGEFAGWAAIGGAPDSGEAEIGWYLSSAHWGRGYATAATELLVDFARTELGLRRLIATADPDNAASRRVLEKCGFTLVGPTADVTTWRGPRPRVLYELALTPWIGPLPGSAGGRGPR